MDDNNFVDLRDELARQQRPVAADTAAVRRKSNVGWIVALSVGGTLLLLGLLAAIGFGIFGFARMIDMSSQNTAIRHLETLEVFSHGHPVEFISVESLPVPHVFAWMQPEAVSASGVRFVATDVHALNLNFINNNITIAPHSDADINVVFVAPENRNYIRAVYQMSGSALLIHDEGLGPFSNLTNMAQGHVRVYLPATHFESIFAISTNGDISVFAHGEYLADEVLVTAVNGALSIGDFAAHSVNASTINGNVSGRNVHVDSDAFLTTVNGSVSLQDARVGGQFFGSTITGNVNVTNVDTEMHRAGLSTVIGRVNISE